MFTFKNGLLALIAAAVLAVAAELAILNSRLEPLNRLPVSNIVDYGAAGETREQRIDRVARHRLQGRDDEDAIAARVRELTLERQRQPTPNPPRSSPPASR